MVHNHWLVGFGSQQVTSVSYCTGGPFGMVDAAGTEAVIQGVTAPRVAFVAQRLNESDQCDARARRIAQEALKQADRIRLNAALMGRPDWIPKMYF